MRARTASPAGRGAGGPPPNAINQPGFSLARAPPRFSIKLRWKPERASDVPGPGAYGTLRLPALEQLLARTARFKSPYPEALATVRRSCAEAASPDTLERDSVASVRSVRSAGPARSPSPSARAAVPAGGSPLAVVHHA